MNAIEKVRTKYPDLSVIVVVPTDVLRGQWLRQLDERGLGLNCKVLIINTASKHLDQCDLLILDEIHKFAADEFSHVFKTVKYKLILGLTATIERLDGKHELLKRYCPVVDTVPIEVAKANGWVADYTEYQVIITAEDIDTSKLGEHNVLINGHQYKLRICTGNKVGLYQEFVGLEDKYLMYFDFNDLHEKILFDNMKMEDPIDLPKIK